MFFNKEDIEYLRKLSQESTTLDLNEKLKLICSHIEDNNISLEKVSDHIVKCTICNTHITLDSSIEILENIKNDFEGYKLLEEIYKVEGEKIKQYLIKGIIKIQL